MFTYTEEGHRYELDGVKMTGVTTVLGILGKPMLIPWAARMTAEWIREHCEYLELTDEQPFYYVTNEDLDEAVKAHTKKKDEGGEKGKDLHSEVGAYIKRCIETNGGWALDPGDVPVSPGLAVFIVWACDNHIRFLSSETPIYSKEWFVAGTPDFTFEKDGKRFVGDLKTYKKIWDRIPHFQCAAYAKMLTEQGDKFDGTCIVNINKETSELTDQWSMALDEDVRAFEAALVLYRTLQNY